MADTHYDDIVLPHLVNNVLRFPPNSPQERTFLAECVSFLLTMQYLKIPRRNTATFRTANVRELRWVDDDGQEHEYEELQYQMMESLRSYVSVEGMEGLSWPLHSDCQLRIGCLGQIWHFGGAFGHVLRGWTANLWP